MFHRACGPGAMRRRSDAVGCQSCVRTTCVKRFASRLIGDKRHHRHRAREEGRRDRNLWTSMTRRHRLPRSAWFSPWVFRRTSIQAPLVEKWSVVSNINRLRRVMTGACHPASSKGEGHAIRASCGWRTSIATPFRSLAMCQARLFYSTRSLRRGHRTGRPKR